MLCICRYKRWEELAHVSSRPDRYQETSGARQEDIRNVELKEAA